MKTLNVTIWCEHRQHSPDIAAANPHGIHQALADALAADDGLIVTKTTLDHPAQGLPDELLNATDVLLWWGHVAHREVSDLLTLKIQKRVLEGMGFIALHSSQFAKPFITLLGTTGQLNYRMDGFETEHIWVVDPGHPIAAGLGAGFVIPQEEVYCEFFDVPPPDELVLISAYAGGEAFRSGMCWRRGAGRIFYFRPGHETLPTYYQPQVQRLLRNAVRWAASTSRMGFESGPKQRGWLTHSPQPGDALPIVGNSHPLNEVLDPRRYVR